jgi:hypothetical protein
MSKNTDLSELINYVKGITSGRLTFPFYTSTTSFTGTVAGYLAFDTSGNILTTTSPSTQWTTSGSNIFYNTGNVGINNSSPAYRLDVVGDINITGAFRINGTSIGTGGGGGVSGSGTANYITKWSGATSLTNSLIFDDGTNVSVGSNNALYRFTVQPSSNINFGIGFTTLFSSNDTIFVNAVNNTYGAVPMVFNAVHLGFYIGFSEAMRITSSKLVLINTTSGVSGGGALQVNGDVNITGVFRVNGTAIGGGGGGTGNINGSGSIGRIPVFTDATVIANSNISTSAGLDSNANTSMFLNNAGSNAGSLTFKAGTSTGEMVIEAYSNALMNFATLNLKSTRVKVTNKLNVGDLGTSGLIVGDLFVDANGFVKRSSSAT